MTRSLPGELASPTVQTVWPTLQSPAGLRAAGCGGLQGRGRWGDRCCMLGPGTQVRFLEEHRDLAQAGNLHCFPPQRRTPWPALGRGARWSLGVALCGAGGVSGQLNPPGQAPSWDFTDPWRGFLSLVLKTLPLPGCVGAPSTGSRGVLEVPSGWRTPTRSVWAGADRAQSGLPTGESPLPPAGAHSSRGGGGGPRGHAQSPAEERSCISPCGPGTAAPSLAKPHSPRPEPVLGLPRLSAPLQGPGSSHCPFLLVHTRASLHVCTGHPPFSSQGHCCDTEGTPEHTACPTPSPLRFCLCGAATLGFLLLLLGPSSFWPRAWL